ncbi:hypothetical protein SBRCBS47491_002207 [Sporothrix bragantina]|uniref:Uncharacterized protein n=1 Tax=Sporothrix bragantina TaxID=671064 RepID=A0ABP0B5M2_9PEZI
MNREAAHADDGGHSAPGHHFGLDIQNGLFYQNRIYIGSFIDKVREDLRPEASVIDKLMDMKRRLGDDGFLDLVPPTKPWSHFVSISNMNKDPAGGDGGGGNYVFKQGGASGLTIGQVSPIEAMVRTPVADGPDVVEGDSGSCIFNMEGEVIALLDARVTACEIRRRLFQMHPGTDTSDAAALPTDPTIPPQMRAPTGFHDWTAVAPPQVGPQPIDIALLTPWEWIVKDILRQFGYQVRWPKTNQ